VDYGDSEALAAAGQEADPVPWHKAMVRLIEQGLPLQRPCELVVYDRRGEERFRSPCSGTARDGVSRFTSHLAPERDIDNASFCVVLDEGGNGLAWWNNMGYFSAREPIVLGIQFD
jgi:hypothetical protein